MGQIRGVVRPFVAFLTFLGGTAAVAEEAVRLDPIVVEAERQRVEAIARAMPATVSVFVPGGGGGGSGVLISPDGFALTNFHVSSPAGAFMRCGLSDGNLYDAVIVGIDPVGDLALIRLLGRDDFPYAEFADPRRIRVGDWCMAIGNPFLLATNLQPSVSFGILSGVGRYQYPSGTLLEYGDCLQTDAAINPGNSGGPLFDIEGRVLGIIGRASFEKRGRVNVGVGYAISIRQVENFLGYLHSGRVVDHATLGATVVTDADRGAVVSNLLESSDAFRRGLRYGAEILEIDGRPVQTANEVQNVLATLPSEWRVPIAFRHQGQTVRTIVRLASVHRPDELLKKMAAALPPPPPRQVPRSPGDREGPGDGEEAEGGPSDPPGRPRRGDASPAGDPAAPGVPPRLAEYYVAREGFANYHFNLLHQQRFIETLRERSAWPGLSPSASATGESSEGSWGWVIDAVTEDEAAADVRLRVRPGELSIEVGGDVVEIRSRAELYSAVESRLPSAMLACLDAWRRMLDRGPDRFGETTYLGTMPLGGQRPLRDCVAAVDGELELRWMTHPADGRLEVIEAIAGRDSDPAELWLSYESDESAAPPSRLELRYGTDTRVTFRVNSWETLQGTAE